MNDLNTRESDTLRVLIATVAEQYQARCEHWTGNQTTITVEIPPGVNTSHFLVRLTATICSNILEDLENDPRGYHREGEVNASRMMSKVANATQTFGKMVWTF